MQQLIKTVMNHKTSFPALAALVLVGLNFANVITIEQLTVSVSVLASVGLFAAKDA